MEVRSKAKCLRIFGWVWIVSGVMTIVGNALYILGLDNQSTIPWVDSDGSIQFFQLEKGGLFFFALMKILTGYFSLRQGRSSLKIVNPILKEYKDAMTGVTQGITMTERKSKAMSAHKKEIK